MRRLALLTFGASLGACGGGAPRASTEAPSARAPELADVGGCDDATLRAFDPGLPGIERVAVEQRNVPDEPLAREHVRACEPAEDDETCQDRARRAVMSADPDASINDISMNGEPVGWQAQLEVDGRRVELRVPQEQDVVAEARRLRSLGHRVVPLEGRRVLLSGSRRATVRYFVLVPRAPARVWWEATLRWPLPSDIAAAIERLQREAERAKLVSVSYQVGAAGITAVFACP